MCSLYFFIQPFVFASSSEQKLLWMQTAIEHFSVRCIKAITIVCLFKNFSFLLCEGKMMRLCWHYLIYDFQWTIFYWQTWFPYWDGKRKERRELWAILRKLFKLESMFERKRTLIAWREKKLLWRRQQSCTEHIFYLKHLIKFLCNFIFYFQTSNSSSSISPSQFKRRIIKHSLNSSLVNDRSFLFPLELFTLYLTCSNSAKDERHSRNTMNFSNIYRILVLCLIVYDNSHQDSIRNNVHFENIISSVLLRWIIFYKRIIISILCRTWYRLAMNSTKSYTSPMGIFTDLRIHR